MTNGLMNRLKNTMDYLDTETHCFGDMHTPLGALEMEVEFEEI